MNARFAPMAFLCALSLSCGSAPANPNAPALGPRAAEANGRGEMPAETLAAPRTSPMSVPPAKGFASFVYVVEGAPRLHGTSFAEGTAFLLPCDAWLDLEGEGRAFVFRVEAGGEHCKARSLSAPPETSKTRPIERLTWAGGQMSATPLFATDALYAGRLEGTLPVAEHVHEGSSELLCAIHAKGTFTLDGEAHRLSDGACVRVPPGHKHAWQPDAGTTLEAIQVYAPPGPEARFRKLAEASPAP